MSKEDPTSSVQPVEKLYLLEGSLGCFVKGWLSLIPVVGLLPAFMVLMEYPTLRDLSRVRWNAAIYYLRAGMVLGALGIVINCVLIGLGILLVLSLIHRGVLNPEDVLI